MQIVLIFMRFIDFLQQLSSIMTKSFPQLMDVNQVLKNIFEKTN